MLVRNLAVWHVCADGMHRVVGPRISRESSRLRWGSPQGERSRASGGGSPRRPWSPTTTWRRPRRSTPSWTAP
ncbi:hypothetical protein SHJG_6326 [Streptomyces hygroscopicus subsp. jinggangensis 5008]|nr:hypothetical protein SHJG_6326 [Streptomyces hygroscopicus subsp. jinggangensis 5008]AGF65750.1 hypothetical protein SHJGH_6087 [Streptomyces hygroscopicus subsp. jinggangensis TL01]